MGQAGFDIDLDTAFFENLDSGWAEFISDKNLNWHLGFLEG